MHIPVEEVGLKSIFGKTVDQFNDTFIYILIN